MSLAAYIWAADLPIGVCNGTAHRVLLKIADRVDELGYGAYPSVDSIAETLMCSTRTVQRGIRELLIIGLIRLGDQRLVDHIRADRRPTVYDCLTPALKLHESRGDIYVTPSTPRGDTYGLDGVTTGVAITVLNPSTKTSPEPHVSTRERAYGRDAS